MALKVIST